MKTKSSLLAGPKRGRRPKATDAGRRFIAKWQGVFKFDPAALKDERVAAIVAKHVR